MKLPLIKPVQKESPGWPYLWFGLIMIAHFIYLAIRCVYNGEPENILWISHVGTLIGGIGAVTRNRVLISVALISLAGHHASWLVDTLTWLFTGTFPFGTTTYLKDANVYDWLQSSNHFFSMPFLLVLAYFRGGIQRHAWIGSSLLFVILAVLSYFISPVSSNVNSVHQLWPGLDTSFMAGIDQLPSALYIGALVLINTVGNYLPTYGVVALLIGVSPSTLTKDGETATKQTPPRR